MSDPLGTDPLGKNGVATPASRDPKKQFSLEDIEQAVAFTRQAALRQIEGVHAVMDGAILAAEQVQDKRLELLELGPEVEALDAFLEFAWNFFLESPLAGRLVQGITQALLLPRVRASKLVRMNALRSVGLRKGIAGAKLAIPATIEANKLIREVGALRLFERALVHSTPEGGTAAYIVAISKAATQSSKPREQPPLQPSDTPGVSILTLAQEDLSRQRLAIQTEQVTFELWLRTRLMTPDEAYEQLKWDWFQLNGEPVELSVIRDQYKRYFEIMIWALLLYERPFTGKSATTPRQHFTLNGYVQRSLIDYWVKRFVDPKTNRPFCETPALRRPDGKPDLDRSVGALGNYMWSIAAEAVKKNARLTTNGELKPRGSLL